MTNEEFLTLKLGDKIFTDYNMFGGKDIRRFGRIVMEPNPQGYVEIKFEGDNCNIYSTRKFIEKVI